MTKKLWWVLIALLVIRFHPFLLQQTLVFGDNFSLMVPGKLFTAYWFKQGVVPLWNPTIFAGIPWMGDVNQSVLYPSSWLFVFFSPGWALNLNSILHLGLTFVGLVWLARELGLSARGRGVAAILWTLSPQLTEALNNLSVLQSLAWMPWVVWAGLRVRNDLKSQLLFATLVTAQFLGGYPQHVVFTILVSLLFSARFSRQNFKDWKKWSWVWLKAGLLAVGLSSFVWLPFVEALIFSTRQAQSAAQQAAGSLHPAELIKIIFPYFFEKPTAGYRWGPVWNGSPRNAIYLSWLGLLALLTSWKKVLRQDGKWWLLVAGALLLSLGGNLPGSVELTSRIPILGAMRGPGVLLTVAALAGSLWIGQRLEQPLSLKGWQVKVILALLGLAWLSYLVMALSFDQVYTSLSFVFERLSFFTFEKTGILATNLSWHLLWHLIFLVTGLWVISRQNMWLWLVLVFELVFFTQGHLFFGPKHLYQPAEPIFAQQLSDPQYRALTRNFNQEYTDFGAYWDALTIRQPFLDSYVDQVELENFAHLDRFKAGLSPDWNMVANVPMIHGYTTLLPQDVDQRWNGQSEVGINNLPPISLNNRLLSDWAVKYYLVDTWWPYLTGVEGDQPLAAQDWWELYELPAQARFRYLDNRPVELNDFVETPNKISFTTTAIGDESLIVADRYDPNWRATINQQAVGLKSHQGIRRLELIPGENRVELSYEPWSFYLGLMLSVGTLLTAWWVLRYS